MFHDLRHAFRTMLANPAFTAVAIVSLALGIGANTAIFSFWKSVMHSPLPGVENPQSLVMLTNPETSGLWRGRWNTALDGPRSWVSYAEFEQLRDHASSFSAVMASQSSLNTWQVFIEGTTPEDVRGRLVSGEFFEVLGVRPVIGRLFTSAEDDDEPLYAVISHAYWLRRFRGRPDVVGRSLTFRDTTVTIAGVAAAGFVGETGGQLPDVWLPLRLQPRLLPGSNWLREQPPDKVMWLHVFGRLKPGVTTAQAEAQANVIFQSGLESFYGTMDPARHDEFLNQHLRIYPGARGASSTLGQFSTALTAAFASVGILLLITCANLANLLMARGAARQRELAVRVSLGASRGRLVRQLVTEALAFAALGGVAAIAVAFGLHGALLRLLQQADARFFVTFSLDLPVLVFAVAATMAAALAVGTIPALQMTRLESAIHLRNTRHGSLGSAGQLRSVRWLVAAQLGLSLPLVVAAGLLVRTVYNLQDQALGFRPERLLIARVNLGNIADNPIRRDRVLRELQERIERTPGVERVSFSQLGVFSGGFSTTDVDVEGSALTREGGYLSAFDRVSAGYFTTLGIPIRMGRDISGNDRAGSQKVCVINEAFATKFFGGRHPLGMRVTTIDDNGERTPHEVVGVVADARTYSVRGDIEPRFYVPAEQEASADVTRTFLIRTGSAEAAVAAALRSAAASTDPTMSVRQITRFEEQLADATAEERALARLSVVFGMVALSLAVIGLYGVLSYSVSRRSSEIAMRIALGARRQQVIALMLRESTVLVLAGLLAGTALSFLGSRVIASRLYGVAPEDSTTLLSAAALLLLVALAAAYLPARRASRVNPIAVLHES